MLRASTFALVVLLALPALAADDPFASVDDAAKKRGGGSPVLVVIGKDDGDLAKNARTAAADKKIAKLLEGGVAITRIDPTDEDGSKKLGVPVESSERVVVLDGYGIVTGKPEKTVTADVLNHLVRDAQNETTKKKKIEKSLDGAVARGEKALKADDTKTACEQFAAVVEYEKTVPCNAVTTAKKHLKELTDKGMGVLSKAQTALGKSDFAQANKLVAEAKSSYPTPEVIEAAKKIHEEIAAAEVKQQQQMGK